MNKLFLVSRQKIIYDGIFKSIKLFLTNGEVLILPNHAPMIGELVKGSIFITTEDDQKKEVKNESGFIIVSKDKVQISLVENIENAK